MVAALLDRLGEGQPQLNVKLQGVAWLDRAFLQAVFGALPGFGEDAVIHAIDSCVGYQRVFGQVVEQHVEAGCSNSGSGSGPGSDATRKMPKR